MLLLLGAFFTSDLQTFRVSQIPQKLKPVANLCILFNKELLLRRIALFVNSDFAHISIVWFKCFNRFYNNTHFNEVFDDLVASITTFSNFQFCSCIYAETAVHMFVLNSSKECLYIFLWNNVSILWDKL